MSIWEIILIGISLAMDAFAVSIVQGLKSPKFSLKKALIIAIFFGGFQALMPTIGYLVASLFADLIVSFDHWVAFVILAFIGGKMIFDSFHEESKEKIEKDKEDKIDYKNLVILAIATSIDALAVGISFAFVQKGSVPIITYAAPIIGVITFVICLLGVGLGNKVGSKFQNKATLIGGIVLILIGLKILLEHLGVLVL